ncbi:Peptidoglycan/LPS O-acetylase OafA/YrhL, contains acyltransferase and SGNH-hydrolase domains [Rhizobium sp. NFR03]|nr:Peptidoglycan/LPS O-acetylase OafA/YrhL, contains acyltransferase and SGNH-hydrolase domains [Rhizobium sp. NFR03]
MTTSVGSEHVMSASHLDYRPDLDGLRALAILPVLLFHADVSLFRGGFVGVDVFFVLSGYFMARIILSDLVAGTFSFPAFYIRRIKRIIPALFTMMAVTAVIAWFRLMPEEFRYFGDSVRAAALFTANVLFRQESGYFDISAEMKPLLHTWSLSMEEQFYILFPISLFLVFSFARRYLLHITSGFILVSFVACLWATAHSPEKAFFLLHFRVWELLIGALVAFAPRPNYDVRVATGLSTVGLAAVLAAIFLYSDATPFPGPFAAIPVLGAALVIHAGSQSRFPAYLLTNGVAVFIGRISYSLYLWHWPIIVFYRYETGHSLTLSESLIVILLSFAAAIVSWRFIEQPARYAPVFKSRRLVLSLMGGAMAGAVAFGFVVTRYAGLPQRLPDDVYAVYAATYDQSPFFAPNCFANSNGDGLRPQSIRDGDLCPMGSPSAGPAKFLVWGDSHAAAIAPAIDEAARKAGVSGLFVGRASCPPLPGAVFGPDHIVARCVETNAAILSLIEKQRFPYVFMVGYWPKYVHRTELPEEGVFFTASEALVLPDWSAPVRYSLKATIAAFAKQGTRVILVQDVPEMGVKVPEALARAKMTGENEDLSMPFSYTLHRQKLARDMLLAVARETRSSTIDPFTSLCDETRCHPVANGGILYRDGDHLSLTGARYLAPLFDETMAMIARPASKISLPSDERWSWAMPDRH